MRPTIADRPGHRFWCSMDDRGLVSGLNVFLLVRTFLG